MDRHPFGVRRRPLRARYWVNKRLRKDQVRVLVLVVPDPTEGKVISPYDTRQPDEESEQDCAGNRKYSSRGLMDVGSVNALPRIPTAVQEPATVRMRSSSRGAAPLE